MGTLQMVQPSNSTLISIARLNIRKGQPNTSSFIVEKVEVGALLQANGLVKGEAIHGNSDWYAAGNDTFFWSGAVKEYVTSKPIPVQYEKADFEENKEIASSESDFEQFIDRLGLRHFKGSEFTPYWSRLKNGVANSVPPMSLWNNIIKTIIILDALRHENGVAITLLSTYRSPRYNTAIGGEPASFHMKFMAIDFSCEDGHPESWAEQLKGLRGQSFNLPGNAGNFIFSGGIGVYPTNGFVHVDTRGYDANWKG